MRYGSSVSVQSSGYFQSTVSYVVNWFLSNITQAYFVNVFLFAISHHKDINNTYSISDNLQVQITSQSIVCFSIHLALLKAQVSL